MAADPGRAMVVSPAATRPAIAKVIASRWSSRLSVAAPRRRRAAVDRDVVAVDVDPRAERAQAGRDPGDPVRFLVAQLAGAADRGRALGDGGRQAQDRDLVDGRGDLGRAEVDPRGGRTSARRGRPAARRRRRRAPVVPSRPLLDVGAHAAQEVDDGPARRVDADVAQGQLGVGVDRAGDEPERGGRDVAGTRSSIACTADPSLHRPGHRPSGPSALDRDATGAEHPLRVVARRDRLADRRPPSARSPASRIADLTWALGTGVA